MKKNVNFPFEWDLKKNLTILSAVYVSLISAELLRYSLSQISLLSIDFQIQVDDFEA